MTFKKIISISRPRFWIYEFGTFLFGVLAGATAVQSLLDPLVLLYGFYFLLPANILIYGINDIYDYETDKLNPKKNAYEELLTPAEHKTIWKSIIFTTTPFVLVSLFIPSSAFWAFCFFIFFATFYSAKPIRAKTKPFFDSFFSAGHYIATGVFGYYLNGGTTFPYIGVIAGMLWAIAMHAYSAVPDITADSQAGMQTIATKFGGLKTLVLCALFYVAASVLAYSILGIIALFCGLVYLALMIISIKKRNSPDELFRIYTFFPYINMTIGMIITIVFLLRHVL